MKPYILYIKTLALCVLISFVLSQELLAQVSLDLGNKYYVSSERQISTTYKNTLKNSNDEGYFLLGTIASKEEICSLFKHPVFSKEKFQGFSDVNYVYIPIDRIIEEFVSMLPFTPTHLGMYSEDRYKWAKRGELFKLKIYEDLGKRLPDITSTCLPIDLFQNEKNSYSGYSSLPLIVWQEAYKDTYPDRIITRGITITTGTRIITDKRNLRDINIYALLLLKEMHPALIKRFDELHQVELERLIEIEARNLELEKEKMRLEVLAKAQAEAQEHERKIAAEIRKEENRLRAEKERIALMEKELEIKAEENRQLEIKLAKENELKRKQFWDKVKTFFASLFFIGCAVVLIIRNLQIKRENKIKAEKARDLLEEEREERARKSELEAERQLKKGRTTRWMKKGRKIQREINSVKKSIETINKQDVTNNKQIERLESEKKLIEDNIDQLNKDIKGEKKVVSKLRKKYPFIDVYIANR